MREFGLSVVGSYRHMNAGLILSDTMSFFLQVQYNISEILTDTVRLRITEMGDATVCRSRL